MMKVPQNNLMTGAGYFSKGIKLLLHPQLRAYILVPLTINVFLFVVLTAVLIHYFSAVMESLTFDPPTWLPFAEILFDIATVLLGIVLGVLVLIVYGYSFNVITNIIAGPFYGILSEKTELLLNGTGPPPEKLVTMVPRIVLRELTKLLYFLTRGVVVILVILLIGTIPVVNVIAPLVGLGWGAWSMAIQYADYPADNHQKAFSDLRNRLSQKMYSSFGFGGMIMLCSVVPVLNIVAMPAAVTGGTLFWLDELSACREKTL